MLYNPVFYNCGKQDSDFFHVVAAPAPVGAAFIKMFNDKINETSYSNHHYFGYIYCRFPITGNYPPRTSRRFTFMVTDRCTHNLFMIQFYFFKKDKSGEMKILQSLFAAIKTSPTCKNIYSLQNILIVLESLPFWIFTK